MQKRLVKGTDKKIFGVCSGLGNYFDIDPTVIRVLFLVAFIIFRVRLVDLFDTCPGDAKS